MALAREFSPEVELTSPDTVMFSIQALRKLLGSPHQIGSEICRVGHERKIQANLSVSANPDTAVLTARNLSGVTFITPGEERYMIAPLPLECLFSHDVSTDLGSTDLSKIGISRIDPGILDLLKRWGLKTCGDLAALPEMGIAERLGKAGIYLRNLALGTVTRPLRIAGTEANYEEHVDLDHPVQLLEPLLFLLARVLNTLCGRLRAQSQAARELEARFKLDNQKEYCFTLEFPVPLEDSATILKLLQLHLERHSPNAPIVAFCLRLEPADPRRIQGNLYLPPTPPADKLQTTLARIEAMVGTGNVGTPTLLNTHRPDAFEMNLLSSFGENLNPTQARKHRKLDDTVVRLAIRLFRPALHASVKTTGITPKSVVASGVEGSVVKSAGPWKISGDWWTSAPWSRDEWDVALDDGVLYRIYCESQSREWYVFGVYD